MMNMPTSTRLTIFWKTPESEIYRQYTGMDSEGNSWRNQAKLPFINHPHLLSLYRPYAAVWKNKMKKTINPVPIIVIAIQCKIPSSFILAICVVL